MIRTGDCSALSLNQASVLVDMMPDENDVSVRVDGVAPKFTTVLV